MEVTLNTMNMCSVGDGGDAIHVEFIEVFNGIFFY